MAAGQIDAATPAVGRFPSITDSLAELRNGAPPKAHKPQGLPGYSNSPRALSPKGAHRIFEKAGTKRPDKSLARVPQRRRSSCATLVLPRWRGAIACPCCRRAAKLSHWQPAFRSMTRGDRCVGAKHITERGSRACRLNSLRIPAWNSGSCRWRVQRVSRQPHSRKTTCPSSICPRTTLYHRAQRTRSWANLPCRQPRQRRPQHLVPAERFGWKATC